MLYRVSELNYTFNADPQIGLSQVQAVLNHYKPFHMGAHPYKT